MFEEAVKKGYGFVNNELHIFFENGDGIYMSIGFDDGKIWKQYMPPDGQMKLHKECRKW